MNMRSMLRSIKYSYMDASIILSAFNFSRLNYVLGGRRAMYLIHCVPQVYRLLRSTLSVLALRVKKKPTELRIAPIVKYIYPCSSYNMMIRTYVFTHVLFTLWHYFGVGGWSGACFSVARRAIHLHLVKHPVFTRAILFEGRPIVQCWYPLLTLCTYARIIRSALITLLARCRRGLAAVPSRNTEVTVLRSVHIDKKSREQFHRTLRRKVLLVPRWLSHLVTAHTVLEVPSGISMRVCRKVGKQVSCP